MQKEMQDFVRSITSKSAQAHTKNINSCIHIQSVNKLQYHSILFTYLNSEKHTLTQMGPKRYIGCVAQPVHCDVK